MHDKHKTFIMQTFTLSLLCFMLITNVNSQATTALQQDNLPEVPWDIWRFTIMNYILYFKMQVKL
jgi:hypothetical protein